MAVWLRLAVAGAATLMVGMGIGRFSYAPLMPALIRSDALSVAEAGYVGAFNLAGYLVGALVTPVVRARFREAAILKVCLWLSLACLAASIAPWGFAWLAFWRFLVGCTVAVMMIGALALVTRAAPPERLGRATGIVFTGVGVGILFAGSMVPFLLQGGLAMAWSGLAVLGAFGVAVGHWGWSGADAPPQPPPQGRAPVTSATVRLTVGQGMFSIGMVPFSIYVVDYAVRGLGHSIAFGGLIWALFGIGALTGTLLWGRLADRVGFGAGLSTVFAVLAVAVAVPVVWPTPVVLMISAYVFGTQHEPRLEPFFDGAKPGADELSAAMMKAWCKFAATGNPGVDEPAPSYSQNRSTLIFGVDCRTDEDPYSAERHLWDQLDDEIGKM